MEKEDLIEDELVPFEVVKPNESNEISKESTQEYRTRSGRVSKPPERLQVGS